MFGKENFLADKIPINMNINYSFDKISSKHNISKIIPRI